MSFRKTNIHILLVCHHASHNEVTAHLTPRVPQVQIPLFEELISRSSRLQASLSSMVTVFSSFLETSEKICYHAVESKSDPDMGLCLERIVTRHRHMELILKTLARSGDHQQRIWSFQICMNLTWLSFSNLNRKLPTHFFLWTGPGNYLTDHKLFERFMFLFASYLTTLKHLDSFMFILLEFSLYIYWPPSLLLRYWESDLFPIS